MKRQKMHIRMVVPVREKMRLMLFKLIEECQEGDPVDIPVRISNFLRAVGYEEKPQPRNGGA